MKAPIAAAILAAAFHMPTTRAAEPLTLTNASFMEIDQQLISAKGRPNEEFRLNALKAYVGGHYPEAIERFEKAARYADKYSQHCLSLIYWHGMGVSRDPMLAYIWSDLAAERGQRRLLAIREKMWAQLTPQQQQDAITRGQEFYARYGDAVAKPRAEDEMRRFAHNMTGSRVGYRSQMMETGGGPVNGAFGVATGSNAAAYQVSKAGSPDELYGREGGTRRLQTYWQQQDAQLETGAGRVDIGPISRGEKPKK
jgi:hypothetical protein